MLVRPQLASKHLPRHRHATAVATAALQCLACESGTNLKPQPPTTKSTMSSMCSWHKPEATTPDSLNPVSSMCKQQKPKATMAENIFEKKRRQ